MGCHQTRGNQFEPASASDADASGIHSQVKVSDQRGTSFHYTQQGFVGFSAVTIDSAGEPKVEQVIIITPSERNKTEEKFVYFLSTPSM